MDNLQDWQARCAEKTKEAVLETIANIIKERADEDRLDDDELDDLKDCWKILHMCSGTVTR